MRSIRAGFTTVAAAAALFVALSTPAKASFIFTASGTASSDGRDENGQATFSIFANTITIALQNTGGPGQVGGISSVLDGIRFDLTGGTSTLTLASLTGSAPSGGLDCSSGAAVCTVVAAPSGAAPAPFGWTMGAGPNYFLAAGGGSLKPEGIVNNNVTGNTDGTSNGPHNPYLNGIVTFTIGFAGGTAPTGISNVVFTFGTNTSDTQTGCLVGVAGCSGNNGTVPEPITSGLVGSGLIGLFFLRRRVRG